MGKSNKQNWRNQLTQLSQSMKDSMTEEGKMQNNLVEVLSPQFIY